MELIKKMSELREKVLEQNKINKLKDKLYDKWIKCFNECYNKSHYRLKCGVCSFIEFCENKK